MRRAALVLLALAALVAAGQYLTAPDCAHLTASDCERIEHITIGAID
jgi:hypothetical protein